MLIERKAERRCRCGFAHYMTLAGELMFGNEPPKSPDALDRKPLARTAQEFRGTRPVIVIASGQRECVPDDRFREAIRFSLSNGRMDCFRLRSSQ
jgi:hypothetical protein